MVHAPVSGNITVDTPPTSHRSHGEYIGSSPIAVCSAPWAAPAKWTASSFRSSTTLSGITHQQAWVIMVWVGISRATESHTSLVISSRRRYPTTCSVSSTCPHATYPGPQARRLSSRRILTVDADCG